MRRPCDRGAGAGARAGGATSAALPDATVLHVKEWVHEKLGIPPVEQRVVVVQGGRVLHKGVPLNSDKKFLKLKVVGAELGGCSEHSDA